MSNERDRIILEQAKAAHAKALKAGISRVWNATYAHDRRAHRHRCLRCSRIIKEGEPVTMYRYGVKTRALHAACIEMTIGPDSCWTYRDLALAHAYEHAIQ